MSGIMFDYADSHLLPRPSAGSRARGTSSRWTCVELGGVVRSVLGRSEWEVVWHINRVDKTLPLLVYEGTRTHFTSLVALHLLDRSCMSVGFFFWNCMLRSLTACVWKCLLEILLPDYWCRGCIISMWVHQMRTCFPFLSLYNTKLIITLRVKRERGKSN